MKIAVLVRPVRAMQRSAALALFPVAALAQTQTEGHRWLALVTGFGSAKQIGLTIPSEVLARANRLIK
jgi:hypothetical protein